MKKNFNRLRFDRIMVMSLWPTFLAHPVHLSLCVCVCQIQRHQVSVRTITKLGHSCDYMCTIVLGGGASITHHH